MSAVYSSTIEAPARMCSHASSALATPPTPMIGILPRVCVWMSRISSRARISRGRPLRPPGFGERLARDAGVACHDTVDSEFERGVADSKQLVALQVGRKLHQHRTRRIAFLLAHRREQLAHLLGRLPVAQAGRVRGTHVDYDEVGQR